jgi:CDP-glucose 4,6-dehydratase
MLEALGVKPEFDVAPDSGCVEMKSLAVDASRAKAILGWRNRLTSAAAVRWTADWHRRHRLGENPRAITLDQIEAYGALPATAATPLDADA